VQIIILNFNDLKEWQLQQNNSEDKIYFKPLLYGMVLY